ncbi:aminoacyl--tRNA ligase-related protein [Stetteria hydrogenophila]
MEKTHMDYAYDLDLVVKPDSSVPEFGREFGAFTGAGIPLFSLGGGVYRSIISEILVKFHALRGYFVVETPIIASSTLFEASGHLSFYRKNMFLFDIEGHQYAIKPMNCPYHILIFMHELARYRSKVPLPFKIFEVGRVHRYEPSGSLYGLLRVRGFTQDDAHIIAPGDAAVESVFSVVEEMKMLYEQLFGLPVNRETVALRLSFSDKSLIGTEFMGTREEWEAAEGILEEAARRIRRSLGLEYTVEPGEAAFYGPKIDVIMRVEEAGTTKEWQAGTIQFDFNLPRRFKLYKLVRDIYGVSEVYIIHRALMGSIERFLGIYLEHVRGRLPFVLAPIQVLVVAIKTGGGADPAIEERVRGIVEGLRARGLRAALLETTKTSLSGEIRRIESTVKPPVTVFIGESEALQKTVSMRIYDYRERRQRSLRNVKAASTSEAVDVVEAEALKLEEPVRKLIGYAPRLPVSLGHIA